MIKAPCDALHQCNGSAKWRVSFTCKINWNEMHNRQNRWFQMNELHSNWNYNYQPIYWIHWEEDPICDWKKEAEWIFDLVIITVSCDLVASVERFLFSHSPAIKLIMFSIYFSAADCIFVSVGMITNLFFDFSGRHFSPNEYNNQTNDISEFKIIDTRKFSFGSHEAPTNAFQ